MGHSMSNVSLLRGGSPNIFFNYFLSILVQMLRFGAIFSPIGLILAKILFKNAFLAQNLPKMGKLRFFAQLKAKLADFFTQPQFLTIF